MRPKVVVTHGTRTPEVVMHKVSSLGYSIPGDVVALKASSTVTPILRQRKVSTSPAEATGEVIV